MKKFSIVMNHDNSKAYEASEYIKVFLLENGADEVNIIKKSSLEGADNGYRYTNPKLVPDATESIIVLGGDGTMLQTARDLVDIGKPLIGINFGNLGFLADIDKDNLESTLLKLLKDEYTVESRMMIKGEIYRNKKIIAADVALNDIVINRCGSLEVIDFKISVNGQYLSTYRADGIIISTPTGSTAYNMSAGGPVVNPSAKLMVVTPICPHTLNSKSIILDKDDEIEIEMLRGHREYKGSRIAAFDGDQEIGLGNGDRIVIKKSEKNIDIIKSNSLSFLQILRRKMNGNEGSQTQ